MAELNFLSMGGYGRAGYQPQPIGFNTAMTGSPWSENSLDFGARSLAERFGTRMPDLGFSPDTAPIGVDGGMDLMDWGQLGLGTVSSLGNLYLGMQQYGLAEDMLEQRRDAFERNFAAQRQTTNTRLRDRQRARVAANPGAYQSVGAYMDQNRI